MKRSRLPAALPLLAMLLLAGRALAQASEPWQAPYAGADASGAHVIGSWQFNAGAETQDASANGLHLKLQGATIEPKGLFGPCLESFAGYPAADKRHAAVVATSPVLTPRGAFTIELWLRPKPELPKAGEAYLVDKMYAKQTDYQLTLSAPDKSGQRRLTARLGFGDAIATYHSDPAKYEAGTWYHVAFTYDGAGEGRFYRDGAAFGSGSHPDRGAIVAGALPLSIGDRGGSFFHGFPGYLAQVRLCNGVLEFRPASVTLTSDRATFVRMERSAAIQVTVANHRRDKLASATLTLSLDGKDEKAVPLPELAPNGRHAVDYPIDTSLRPDAYKLRARIEIPGVKPYVSDATFSVRIVNRPLPERMPVVMWGVYSPERVMKEMARLKDIGFTHSLGLSAEYGPIWKAKAPAAADKPQDVTRTKRMLDAALANDFGVIATLSPVTSLKTHADLLRVGRDGKPTDAKRADVCGLTPGVGEFCFNVGASVAKAYGAFPAFQAALLHSEVRGASEPCFHEHDLAAYRKASGGQEIPKEIKAKSGVRWEKIAAFPADRVVPDDYPILQYLRWYWKGGDGWNDVNSALHRGLKSTGRNDLWTFHDPAVRVASTYGSGGAVDVVSQWTYSNPDPIRIGMSTDELFAMAGGAAQPQRVMSMTQIIWYRSQTAPVDKTAEKRGAQSPWEDFEADASFLTIAPLHLRQAFWTKMARPIRGIMYHGWESLVATDSTGGYRYTNPQTQHELQRLIKEVVEPLGPTLLQVPDRPSDVGFLESFASQMLAGRGTYGWNTSWAGDAYHVLQYAQLQPEIVYDETVTARGLDRFKVLFMMDCDVLTESVARSVKEFQRKGGIVIADERLAPAIKADATLQSAKRTGKADEDRATLLNIAKVLREMLDGRYKRYVDSNNPNVIVRDRTYGSTDYLFAVNDLREYGDYVGQHGRVMENGLPSDATLTVARKGGHVYDLLAGREVKTDGPISARLGPCEGRVYMITQQAIDRVRIDVPPTAKAGEAVTCRVSVEDAAGKPIDAVIPLRFDVLDAQGRAAEFSGFYGAKDGRLVVRLDLARNDTPGAWEVRAKDLASGATGAASLRVTR